MLIKNTHSHISVLLSSSLSVSVRKRGCRKHNNENLHATRSQVKPLHAYNRKRRRGRKKKRVREMEI